VFSNPFFWMWAMNNHNQQAPVYVNNGGGGGQPQQVAQGAPQGDQQQMQAPQQDNGPGFFGMIFWGLVNLIILLAIITFLIWGGRKIYLLFRG